MEATRSPDGGITLRLSEAEAVVLHETIAFSDWSNELDVIELREPAERKVVSDVQQSLALMIPELGTGEYGKAVDRAIEAIELHPF